MTNTNDTHNSIEIKLPNGKYLVASVGEDPNYPNEIYVYQRDVDGTERDIAYIGQSYVPGSDPAEYVDNEYRVMTADDNGNFGVPKEVVRLNPTEN